ncbi:penicillin-binding protein [Cellulosimicrobium cellulans]|uniref:transglycosylase domain-containing protein n=1 Tax=Cellulosimicrobium cellulans TaxID=1710 RepID=UPI00196270F1|nr:transglycosylase domain-containing protein [Cellulosimicrobium cellulans]MBN0038602.1 penicillin-binding protein [Cellulosimicrobium cellulans]
MARSTRTNGRATPRGRRRFFNYPRSHVKSFRRWLPSWRVVVGTMLTGVALVAGVAVAAWFTTDVPTKLPSVGAQTSTVYWGDGTTEMGTYAVENREIVDFETLPDYVGNAVVASEDRTFWTNSGVDVRGIARAFYNNLKGGGRQGASTLTQQYVERYYTSTVTDYAGKAREAILALKITQQQEKSEILGNYLNTIYFGRGAYGIQAAAQKYYGVNAADLTVSQAAMISGIIPSPTNWDPANNPEQAEHRWKRSLDNMLEDGHIDKAQYDEAIAGGFPATIEYVKSDKYAGPTGYLLAMVEEELASEGIDISEDDLTSKGYTVVTTIDQAMQDAAVTTAESLPRAERGDENPVSENIRAAIVSIDPNDGSVRALYGGRDFLQNQYNNATRGAAQGGSTFKPFTLIAGLENGHTLDERFDGNSPKTFPGADNGSDWKVRNFGDHDWGTIDLTEATAQSVNTAYAELNLEVGPEKTADVAGRLGIKADVGSNLANVLGDATVTPLELTNAYATIAAQGMRATPHIVASVTDARGNLVYQAPGADKRQQEFAPDVMAAATYALSQVVEQGSGEPAQAIGRPAAGKTGTSTDNRSAWFAGFTPGLATVVGLYQSGPNGEQEQITPFGKWVGDEITGGSWPVEAWTSYMQTASANLPVGEFPTYTPPKPQQPVETPTETPTDEATEEVTPDEPEQPEQPENVAVPSVVGMESRAARAQLEAAGLKVRITEEFSDQQPRGFVISQSSMSEVPPGSTIALVVSKGADPGQEPPPETPDPEDPDPSPTETGNPDGGGGSGGGTGNPGNTNPGRG